MLRRARLTSLPIRFLQLEDRTVPAGLTVNSNLDTVVPDNVLTLREAIAAVNAGSDAALSAAEKALITGGAFGNDFIEIDESLSGATITMSGGSFTLSQPVDIFTNGAKNITLDAGKLSRHMVIDKAGSSGSQFTLQRLNFINGQEANSAAILLENETLTITGCSFSNNTATSGNGVINANVADSEFILQFSTLANNSVSAKGGGITANGDSTVTLNSVTIANNTAGSGGGAIRIAGGTTLTIRNSTITGNSAGANGGGIYDPSAAGATITIESSIVSGNTASGTAPDLRSNVPVTVTKSAIGSNDGFTFAVASSGNLAAGIDLKLGPLQDNGGFAPSIVPASDSPLVGQGSNPNNEVSDSRGNGFPRQVGPAIDIGATEAPGIPITFVVTNTNDAGPGSLRQSILDADANAATADTITFAANVKTVTLTSGELLLTDTAGTTINGGSGVTITRSSTAPAFRIMQLAANANADINGLTISNGNATGSSLIARSGGGVLVNTGAALALTNSILSGNSAGFGGGIYNKYGTATLTNSTLSGNSAGISGGGIFNSGTVILTISNLAGNTSNAFGGGITNFGILTLTNSTLSGNTCNTRGGGLYNLDPGTVTLTNSTLSGNSANTDGGGIFSFSSGTVTLTNCTVTANRANADGNASGTGGGISNSGGTVTLFNSIVAGNFVGTDTTADNVTGTLDAASKNNLTSGDAKLGPLANNGGPVFTHALLPGSPAINAGSNALIPGGVTTDARGLPRTALGTVDIGAVELQSLAGPYVVDNAGDGVDGDFSAGKLTLREAVLMANDNAGADAITFAPTVTTATLTLGELLMTDTASTTINGGSGVTITRGGATAFRIMQLAANAKADLIGLTLTNGHATGSGSDRFGGGVFVNTGATLTLTNSTLSGNSASVGAGGIYNTGTLRLTFSTLTGNTAGDRGGGIGNYGSGTVALTSTTLSGNMAPVGGGIRNSNTLTLTNSTLSDNVATFAGGGISNVGIGTLTLTNSTLSGNTATRSGGGIYNFSSGTVTLTNSTVTANRANSDGNTSGTGGGIRMQNGMVTLFNTIVAGNFVGTGTTDDNVVGTIDAASKNNLIDTDVKLAPLANNGGPVFTHALLSSSPAINAGDPAVTTADARGFPVNDTRDIGAFEVQPIAITPSILTLGILNAPYSQTINVSAATLPAGTTITRTHTGGTLPPGLTLAANGTLSGTPTATGQFNFTVTATASTGDSATRDYQFFTVVNQVPTITTIGDQTSSGASVGPLAFTVSDPDSSPANLTVTATSSNPLLVPLANITLGGSGSARTVTVQPAAANFGTTIITLMVTDSIGAAATTSFTLLVSNTSPTISAIGNATSSGAAVGPLAFTIGDAETPATNLTVTAASSNPALVPLTNIVLGGSGANRTVIVTPAGGKVGTATITVTVTDGNGATAQAQFVVTVKTLLENEFSIGRDRGGVSSITLHNADASPRFTLTPFGANFTGGIRTTSGDVTGDGVADLIVASGFGIKGTVKVFDGVTQSQIPLPETVAGGGTPFGDTFTRGIIVAAGDLNADGLSDLIITAEAGGGARVRIFTSTGSSFVQRSDFIALIGGDNKADGKFRGGSRATVSDINGDGTNDLIWAAGAGGGPRIATFNGTLLNNGSNAAFKLSGDFFALATTLRDGAYLGGGDIDGDGIGDVVFGGGSGAPPQVVGYSGNTITQNKFVRFLDFNFGTNSGQGIRVAVKDLNNDNIADVIVGSAPGSGSRVAAFNGNSLRGNTTGTAIFDFTAFSGFTGGVFVG